MKLRQRTPRLFSLRLLVENCGWAAEDPAADAPRGLWMSVPTAGLSSASAGPAWLLAAGGRLAAAAAAWTAAWACVAFFVFVFSFPEAEQKLRGVSRLREEDCRRGSRDPTENKITHIVQVLHAPVPVPRGGHRGRRLPRRRLGLLLYLEGLVDRLAVDLDGARLRRGRVGEGRRRGELRGGGGGVVEPGLLRVGPAVPSGLALGRRGLLGLRR